MFHGAWYPLSGTALASRLAEDVSEAARLRRCGANGRYRNAPALNCPLRLARHHSCLNSLAEGWWGYQWEGPGRSPGKKGVANV
jgi:hypothetical protein